MERLRLFGRFVGKSVFDRQLVDLPLSRSLVMRLLGKKPTLEDLKVRVQMGGGELLVATTCPRSRSKHRSCGLGAPGV